MKKIIKRRKKKVETSKKLLVFAIVFVCIVTAFTFLSVLYVKDISPLEYLIPSAFGLLATAYGFYFWKAKAENLHKYGKDDDIPDSNDPNDVG